MDSIKKQARVAGLLYLLAAIPAPFALIYVPRTLVVPGDPTATANQLQASQTLLRMGIASELIVAILFIFVVLSLYRLFKGVNEHLALTMMVLLLVSIPISFLNVLNNVAAMIFASGASFLSSFEKGQLDTLAYQSLRMHGEGLRVIAVFWGLWLLPFGLLVIRSGFVPRVLGFLLILAGCGYLIQWLTFLFLPQHAQLVGRFTMVLSFGEVPIVFWLLIWGAKAQPSRAPVASSAIG